MVLPVLLLVTYGPTLIALWLGEHFAQAAGNATRVLALGLFFNTIATVPFNFLAAIGRPDVAARFHVAELFVHLPLAWWLVERYGILGAALAWSLRVTLDAFLLFAATLVIFKSSPGDHPSQEFGGALAGVASGGASPG